MSFFSLLSNSLFGDIWKTFITLFIVYVFYNLSKFYYKVSTLPKGPVPLPLIGNLLLFRVPYHNMEVFRKCSQRYGPLFTIWFGSTPVVVITDPELGREAYNKNEFAGRPKMFVEKFICNDKLQDALCSEGKTWEALRKVTHAAAVKFSTNKMLETIVSDCVDKTIKMIMDQHGLNQQFCPVPFIENCFINILAYNAFNQEFTVEELKLVKAFLKEFGEGRYGLWAYSYLMRLYDWRMVKRFETSTVQYIDLVTKKFTQHYEDYDPGIERNFCDALIKAKNDALRDGKESAPYLTDANLSACVWDLFTAGFDTMHITFQWILLLITYYPEIQQKLREEIETQIGDRVPTHEDRNRCHYVMAFLSEALRVRNVSPVAFPRKTTADSNIGDQRIAKDTTVIIHQGVIMTDEKYFPNPQEFIGERFLENGKYIINKPKAYIPFSVGRRSCLGERLAIADLFLVLVRFLQSTPDIVLGENQGIDLNPDKLFLIYPHEYKILFRPRV